MAFAELKQITQAEYNNLSASWYNNTPTKTSSPPSPAPDNRVTIALGGWATGTLMKFTVQNNAGSGSTLSIVDENNQTVTVAVASDASTSSTTTYWSVEVGATDGRTTDWTINFDIQVSNRSTGKWVFKKGTSEPNF